MTKTIRIENADTSTFKVRCYVEDLIDGAWVRNPTPVNLEFPTALTEQHLTSTRRVVVEEY